MADDRKPFILEHPERYAWENIRPIRPHEHAALTIQMMLVTAQLKPDKPKDA